MINSILPGIWGELVVVLLGLVALQTGVVGLALGGRRLPPIEIPPAWRGLANLAFALLTMVGLTVITNTPPDFVERLWNTISR
ncbi:MAG: hypothetical protein H0Z37_09810 [Firmicutes bacterium]|nr:hypothetical protein [Bacillota bacterium]